MDKRNDNEPIRRLREVPGVPRHCGLTMTRVSGGWRCRNGRCQAILTEQIPNTALPSFRKSASR